MDCIEYENIVKCISSNYSEYPDGFSDRTKDGKIKRDNFKKKAQKFFLQGSVLYRHVPGNISGVEVVVKDDVKKILEEFHGSAFGGHSGVNKTVDAIKIRYWWYGLTDDVRNYIKSCEQCQKSDPLKPAQKPELHSIKVTYPFELVGVDLVGPFQQTDDGNKYIFTATDYFTKWVEAFPIKSKTAVEVATCFQKLFSRHGATNAILTDQGREFNNELNQKLCSEWNVKHKVTAAYHPQTNGLDERTNQTLKLALRKLTNEHQTNWDTYIDGVLFSIRTKPHSTTKFSPFYLLYGREAVYPSKLPKDFSENETIPSPPSDVEIKEFVMKRKENESKTAKSVLENIAKAQEKQQKDYMKRKSKGRTFVEIKINDKVLLYDSKKASTKSKSNMEHNYRGPYTVYDIDGKKVTLKNQTGNILKTKVTMDRLKQFISLEEASTKEQKERSARDNQDASTSGNNTAAAKLYIKQLSDSGALSDIIKNTMDLQVPKPKSPAENFILAETCPVTSFILETSAEASEDVDEFASALLPHMNDFNVTLEKKVSLTMLVANLCARSKSLNIPVSELIQTLRQVPCHMTTDVTDTVEVCSDEHFRVVVAGETLQKNDLLSIDANNWLTDKVINAFLGLQKTEQNQKEHDHVFILPSYTAVLWNNGRLDYWLFKKVQFNLFETILMPVNINGNHWVLFYANIKERRIGVLDSLNGNSGAVYLQYWRQFMEKRETSTGEKFGEWTNDDAKSNPQKDGNSCGIFTLMNAECIIKGVSHLVMRQVHVPVFRRYVKNVLINNGKSKNTSKCDLPGCSSESNQRRIMCEVCGRWLHLRCANLTDYQQEYLCVFCKAAYC